MSERLGAVAIGSGFGIYVVDGTILPSAVGANPMATLLALSQRVAEGIIGIAPDGESPRRDRPQ